MYAVMDLDNATKGAIAFSGTPCGVELKASGCRDIADAYLAWRNRSGGPRTFSCGSRTGCCLSRKPVADADADRVAGGDLPVHVR